MSKASQFAVQVATAMDVLAAADALRPGSYATSGCSASVARDGSCELSLPPVLSPETAVGLGRWLVDTFGESS